MSRLGSPTPTRSPGDQSKASEFRKKADLFSFAIIAWEVLTRRQPYVRSNFVAMRSTCSKANSRRSYVAHRAMPRC